MKYNLTDRTKELKTKIKSLKVNIEGMLKKMSSVVVIPHKRADMDALASSVAFTLIAAKHQKECHILMGDDIETIDNGARLIYDQTRNDHSYINLERFKELPREGRLNVLCDVNPTFQIYVPRLIKANTIIIDHHPVSDGTVKSAYACVDPLCSSASEIMVHLLDEYKIKYSPSLANMLLAGIFLDTDHYKGGVVTETTDEAMSLLHIAGANNKEVNRYFRQPLEVSRRVNSIIDRIEIGNYHVGVMVADPTQVYTEEELSIAANQAITNFEIDLAIAIGYIGENLVAIKGRCNEKVDINEFMKTISETGGGRDGAGAVKLPGVTIEEAIEILRNVIYPKHLKIEIGQLKIA